MSGSKYAPYRFTQQKNESPEGFSGIYEVKNWPKEQPGYKIPIVDNRKTYPKAFSYEELQQAIKRAELKHYEQIL